MQKVSNLGFNETQSIPKQQSANSSSSIRTLHSGLHSINGGLLSVARNVGILRRQSINIPEVKKDIEKLKCSIENELGTLKNKITVIEHTQEQSIAILQQIISLLTVNNANVNMYQDVGGNADNNSVSDLSTIGDNTVDDDNDDLSNDDLSNDDTLSDGLSEDSEYSNTNDNSPYVDDMIVEYE